MKNLLRGMYEFRSTRRTAFKDTFLTLAAGQEPDVFAIACSDSRVSPIEFASKEPGDVFVVRNVGNLVPPFTPTRLAEAPTVPAAVEYALAALPIRHVVVCGHSGCGAMRAICTGHLPPATPHLSAWLDFGRSALEGLTAPPSGLALHDHLSQQNVLRQLDNLRTYPGVRTREASGRLTLHGWWFEVARAEVLDYDEASRRFVPLDEARITRLLLELGSQDSTR